MWRIPPEPIEDEQRCRLCGRTSPFIAAYLGLCRACILEHPQEALARAKAAHAAARRLFDLPQAAPRTENGVRCGLCVQDCRIGEGERGFCGLRTVRGGRLIHLAGTPRRGLLHWYRDPLPTNCVADWVCSGHRMRGYHNLAVFYASCVLDCLFCQNWHYREADPVRSETMSARQLAEVANPRTYCVCYFGGDPASQMPHALASAKLLAEKGVVVCWETAGTAHPRLMDRAVQLSLETGGIVKFDLKAYDEGLHFALTGGSNRQTLENFARAAARFSERPEPPLVVASTLLVPGYVTPEEVGRIARFIAEINPEIPYSLLAFAPHFVMPDLPCTSRRHAEEAEEAARAAGLRHVHIGNRHLLW
ncbi:MAG: radical SAM protein [Chloroflexi bacterium]|nr:MAG: radical SAM protein [Chloroflexota bacterium]